MTDKTITFDFVDDHDAEMHRTLQAVYDALKEKGYNPVSQIVGYILLKHKQFLLPSYY